MKKHINIAIDGYSSCGKSTIAKAISKRYKMRYIDTGSMYRAIALYCIDNGIITPNKIDVSSLLTILPDIDVDFVYDSDERRSKTYLNGLDVEERIRGLIVSNHVSSIARIKQVREKLVESQQKIGKEKNIVMDGRDIGTKVFPFADIKFFVTANIELRARRRYDELIKHNEEISYNEVLQNLKIRDENDSNRSINPLRMANDAILVDNSDISVEEQNKFVFNYIDKIVLN